MTVHSSPQQRHRWAIAAVAGLLLVAVPAASAQVPPLFPEEPSTSTTEAPAPTTSTTVAPAPASPQPPAGEQPSGSDLANGSSSAPAGAQDAGGDGAAPPSSGIRVPPEAQRIIDAVPRTGASNSAGLVARLAELHAVGVSEAEALRVGMGRFPIAGPARYGHDWLYPRYGPGFRFHLGTDVFAAHGTPVRAPVDGVAHSSNSGLGGLTVKVHMPDGTYFYLAHLSGLVDGFANGMAVRTGDIVGYVGDSGNARGGSPHLHIGIYPLGGAPIDPKPVLDQFLAEAEARIPELVAAYQAAAPQPTPAAPPVTAGEEPRVLRPLLAEELLSSLAGGGSALPAELIYAAGANPVAGPRALVDVAVEEMVARIDWSERAKR